MKYLGSARRNRAVKRKRHTKNILAVSAAVVAVGFAVAQFRADPVARDPALADGVVEIALPDRVPPDAMSAYRAAGGARLPFEPMVAGRSGAYAVADASPAHGWASVTVAPGDNLSLIFSRLQLSKSDLHEIALLPDARPHLKRLKPGQQVRVQADDTNVQDLVVELDELNSLVVERNGEVFTSHTETIHPEIKIVTASADIKNSLFLSGQNAGLSDALIMRLTDIFGWDIDFALDIRENDHFSVIYEQAYVDGQLIKQGRILAAQFVNRGKPLRAVLFTDEDGNSEYYSDQGHAMRKAFLRSPVNFTRISSHFSMNRKHPILNRIRAHKGVDYAAPMGTPVRATANGKIASVGKNSGYGNTVKMQHGREYSTLYAHLSRFPKGLKSGMTKKQGDIIGYVGKSGLATGPHLHYEFQINGTHRNPLTVDLPKALAIEKRYLAAFRAQAAPLLAQLAELLPESGAPDTRFLAQLDNTTLSPRDHTQKHR